MSNFWQALNSQIFLGSTKFVARMKKKIDESQNLAEIPRAQGRAPAKPLCYYAQKYKDAKIAIYEAFKTGDYSMKQLAEYFGIHYSTVSRLIRSRELELENA